MCWPLLAQPARDAEIPRRERPVRAAAEGAHAHVRREYRQERRAVQGALAVEDCGMDGMKSNCTVFVLPY